MITEIVWTIVALIAFYLLVVSAARVKRMAADTQAIRGLLWRYDSERAADRDLKKALDGIHYAVVIDKNEPEDSDPEPDGVGCTLRIEMTDEEETNEEGRPSE